MPAEDLGLTSEEAKERLVKFGANVLPEKPPPSDFHIFISQLKSPLVYVLIVAGVITLFLGDISDFAIIAFAIFINTILGFVQERKANRALAELKKLIHPEAQVIRDEKLVKIDASSIVPGDVVVLNQGDKVPADGKLISTNRLFISEAILTGESVPLEKKESDKAFMGTIITAGQGRLLVEITGKDTEMGKIALEVQEISEDTPLKKQLSVFSKQLSILVLLLVAFVFVVGILSGKAMLEMFTTSVALAVSAIPEGLLVGLTAVLAIGMQRILKHKGLVRNLVSAETLGGVTTICIDKTGTLTEGKMKVVDVIGDEHEIVNQAILANDLDDPIVIAAWEWALRQRSGRALQKRYPRIDSLPFSSKERFFASLNKWKDGNNIIFVNGAPEYLLKWSGMKVDERKKVEKEIERLTKEGKRVLGLASKLVDKKKKNLKPSDVKGDLKWVGFLAFDDPLRRGVAQALEKTKKAGIKLIVITGDYAETAVSVMKQAGEKITDEDITLGNELENLTKEALAEKILASQIRLFARTTPEQKLKIVDALKSNGEVVAMMGDGVNDAPALNKADIGIVVNSASEVAKESADLVLLDSSFDTIVAAVEEGRGIFDNTRKIILYLISDAFEEITAVVGTIILALPLPVTAAQILWINLISDGLPNLALTVDPKEKGAMEAPPRPPSEKLVENWMKILILLVSFVGGVIGLSFFIYYHRMFGLDEARSVVFAALGVNSLVYVFSIRTLKAPFWKVNPLENIWLNISVVAGIILQILPFSIPSLRVFFKLTELKPIEWVVIFAAGVVTFIIIEIGKVVFRMKFFDR